jgi:hypothetical protein
LPVAAVVVRSRPRFAVSAAGKRMGVPAGGDLLLSSVWTGWLVTDGEDERNWRRSGVAGMGVQVRNKDRRRMKRKKKKGEEDSVVWVGAPPLFDAGPQAEIADSAGTDKSRFAAESRFWPSTGSGVGEIHPRISLFWQGSGHRHS